MGWPSANSSIALLIREGFGVCATIAATPSRRHVAADKQRILFIHAKQYYITACLARPRTHARKYDNVSVSNVARALVRAASRLSRRFSFGNVINSQASVELRLDAARTSAYATIELNARGFRFRQTFDFLS